MGYEERVITKKVDGISYYISLEGEDKKKVREAADKIEKLIYNGKVPL